jgi:amino acid transporter
MVLIPLFFWLLLMVKFVRAFYIEARRTSWSLLESLIAANILGHVIAIPIALAYQDSFGLAMSRSSAIILAAFIGITVAVCMAGGAVWVFRRLKARDEQRRWVRIGYMILGLLLFPTMVAFPWNLVLGWFVWIPLMNLGTTRVPVYRSGVKKDED